MQKKKVAHDFRYDPRRRAAVGLYDCLTNRPQKMIDYPPFDCVNRVFTKKNVCRVVVRYPVCNIHVFSHCLCCHAYVFKVLRCADPPSKESCQICKIYSESGRFVVRRIHLLVFALYVIS